MKLPLRAGGNPLHPLTVHFPVALLTLVAPADALWALDALGRAELWQTGALWLLVGGLASALPAAATGLLDFLALPPRPAVTRAAVSHMVGMAVALCLFALSLLARAAPAPLGEVARAGLSLACSLAGLGCLAWAGHRGAQLVYRHGAGQLPDDGERRGGTATATSQ